MKKNDLTTHELADLLIKLGLIGKILKKIQNMNIEELENLIEEEKFDTILNKVKDKADMDSITKRKKRGRPPKQKNYNKITKSKELENSLYEKFKDMKKDEIIKFAKKEYNHVIPKCSSKNAAIEEAIDVAFMKKGFPLENRPIPLDPKISPDQLEAILKDRHQFPNRFAIIRLGKKLGINLNKKLSIEKMVNKILDARYNTLDRWYRIIEKL